MRKHVRERDSYLWEVIDLNTGKPIRGVQWANDETGKYKVLVFDNERDIAFEPCSHCKNIKTITEVKKGNIQIVRKNKEVTK